MVEWILQYLVPEVIVHFGVRLMGKVLPFTSVKLSLMNPFVFTVEGQRFLLYEIGVWNKGSKVAFGCWPQLDGYPAKLSSSYTAQPLAWVSDLSDRSAPLFKKRDLQPQEKTSFTVAFSSEKDSSDGVYLVEIPTARRDSEHFILDLPTGVHTVRVRLIGDNIYAKPVILRISLRENGQNTWESLKVKKVRWV